MLAHHMRSNQLARPPVLLMSLQATIMAGVRPPTRSREGEGQMPTLLKLSLLAHV